MTECYFKAPLSSGLEAVDSGQFGIIGAGAQKSLARSSNHEAQADIGVEIGSNRYSRRFGRWAVISALFGVILACNLCRPIASAAAEAQEIKLGFVDLGTVFDQYERTKASDAVLERKGKQKESELEGRVTKLRKMRQSLELLNDDARESRIKEIEELADDVQQFRKKTARDLKRERDKIAKDILDDIQAAVDEYAKENGFSLILDNRSIVYGQPAHDITQDIVKKLNSQGAKER